MAGRPFGAFDTSALRSEANVDPFTTFVNNGMRWPTSPGAGASGAPAFTSMGGESNIAAIMQHLSQLLARRPGGLQGTPTASGAGAMHGVTPTGPFSLPTVRPGGGGIANKQPGTRPQEPLMQPNAPTAFTGDNLAKLLQQMHANFAQTGQTGDMPDIQQLQGGLRGHSGTLPPGFTFNGGNNNPIAQQILQMLRAAGG